MDTKTLCLGALSLGDASGYEIKKMFEEGPFSHFYDAGFGSIYPALNSLLEDGYVTCQEMEQVGRPAKKVYSLTEAGRASLHKQLHTVPAKDHIRSDMATMMFFGHLLDPRQKDLVFESYIDQFRDKLRCLHETDVSDAPAERQFIHGLGVALYETALDYLEKGADVFLGEQSGEPEQSKKRAAGGA